MRKSRLPDEQMLAILREGTRALAEAPKKDKAGKQTLYLCESNSPGSRPRM